MTVGKAIYYLLTNYSDLTDIVSTRVFPEVAMQDSALPFVVYTVISNEPSDTQAGPSRLDIAQVDVVIYNTNYSECIDMGVYVRAALDRVTGTYNGVNVQSIQYTSEVIDFEEYSRAYVLTQSYDVRISRDQFEITQGTPVTGAQLGDLADVTLTDLQDHEALVYDQDTATWINGASTKIGIRVINQTGGTLYAGTPLRATGVQGDQVTVAIYNARNHAAEYFIGLLSTDLDNGETGYARQTGAIYNLNTLAFNVGDVLYPTGESIITIDNGLDYMTRTKPGSNASIPEAKIPAAIVLRKHVNTGRVYVRTWSPSKKLGDLDDVAVNIGIQTGDVLKWNGNQWQGGAQIIPSLNDLRDVEIDDPEDIPNKSLLRWDASVDLWRVIPETGGTIPALPNNIAYFLGRYNTEASTARQLADATLTIERYLTVQADGHGEELTQQTDTPTSGNKIVRKIWHKAVSFEDSDVTTWTLIHTFADDTAYANTTATFDALLTAATYGSIPFSLAQTWEDVPPFTGLLDTYSGAAAAYSLRLLDSTYTGDAIRVRRASDNAVQDIGFDANGDLDTSALATFCAGTDGYVVRWYDQSGNGNDAVQGTTANQPKVYDSATGVVTRNSLPTLQFDGTNDLLLGTNAIDPLYITAANAPNTTGLNRSIFGADTGDAVALGSMYFQYNTPTRTPLFSRTTIVESNSLTDFLAKSSSAVANDTMNVMTGTRTTTNINVYLNSNNVGSDTTSSALRPVGGANSGRFTIMAAYYNNNLTDYLQGDLSELIAYTSDQSANRSGIETNINTYYNIF